MELHKALEGVGLTNNEIKIYLALLDLGSSMAGNIAKRAEIHRRPTYDALNRLTEKGLISYTIQAGKKSFQAVDPERILNILKEKEENIKDILPSLKTRFKSSKTKVFTETYEGKEGVKSIMDDILREGKEWWNITTGKGKIIIPYYLKHFNKQRVKLGIKRRSLVVDDSRGRAYLKELNKQELTEAKLLPGTQNLQTFWVYGNKVVIVAFMTEKDVIMFLIENKNVANSYRDYFNVMWKQGKEI